MSLIEIQVPEEFVERGIDSMEDEVTRMRDALAYMQSNDLEHTNAYEELEAELDDLEMGIDTMQEKLESHRENGGLEELFSE